MTDVASEIVTMDAEQRRKANEFIVRHLQGSMIDGKIDLKSLRRKLAVTYWVIVVLSVIMFAIGIILLSVPFYAAYDENIRELEALISGGFGIADLVSLFLFRPIERIHKIMGDMSQIVIALNSFQTQLGLRLMQMDATNRQSMGETAEYINAAAKESIRLIQDYFETVQVQK